MHKVHRTAKELYPFFEAVLAGNWVKAEIIRVKIVAMEQEADRMKRDLRLHLPTGLFLPVARSDLLELLRAQDRIANTAATMAGLIIDRKMVIPETIAPFVLPFLSSCLTASKLACKAINELDELLETGFRGNELTIVEEMIVHLDKIEQDCDDQLAAIRQAIFALEQKLPALEIFFLYKLVQWIGDLADHAQTVGNRLLVLIAR